MIRHSFTEVERMVMLVIFVIGVVILLMLGLETSRRRSGAWDSCAVCRQLERIEGMHELEGGAHICAQCYGLHKAGIDPAVRNQSKAAEEVASAIRFHAVVGGK